MKKTLLTLAAAVMSLTAATAQETISAASSMPDRETRTAKRTYEQINPRKGYTNFAYSTQMLKNFDGSIEIGKSKFGASFLRGRTFNMHRRPIANMIYVGLDATWIDFNYANYEKHILHDRPLHQLDVSMGIGPSINVYPVGKLGVHAYFRFNPAWSMFLMETPKEEDDKDDIGFDIMGGYSSMMVSGVSVSWGVISIGAEARWGAGKYKSFHGEFLPFKIDAANGEVNPEKDVLRKLKHSGGRYYISLRF
jgi:hypothetical protein